MRLFTAAEIPERDILMETRKGVALSYAPTQIAI